MTSLDESAAAVPQASLVATLPASRWQRFENLLARLSDHLNPILVKEARQALRSRQFTTTFLLMLAAGWAWSFLGLALLGPAAYYNAEGPAMFFVYYVILAAPLIIVIPYFAYHSLASERQDRTYELVTITSLDATRILVGKLCGIGLQMMVYLSALFPCLAFTYLLRGLDIFSVLLVVIYTCLISLGMSLFGLLLAAMSPSRQRQIIQGVLFAVLLCYIFGVTVFAMSALVATEGMLLDDPNFWDANIGLAMLYSNAFVLVFLSARALLTAAAQNRSTALRIGLATAQVSAFAWFSWAMLRMDDDIVFGLIFVSTVAWYFAGTIMMGESPALSSRVRRGLPQSSLGRLLFSWLAPGSGTGYLFVLSNMFAMSIVAVGMVTPLYGAFVKMVTPGGATGGISQTNLPSEVLAACVVAVSYMAIYLGLGKLILAAARRVGDVSLMLRVLVHLLLVLAGAGIPWVIQISNPQTRNLDYTLMQITNPLWTLDEYCFRGGPPAGIDVWLLTLLPAAALVVWGLNLPSVIAELSQGSVPKPPRVAEEDAELAAAAVPVDGRTSPWDD